MHKWELGNLRNYSLGSQNETPTRSETNVGKCYTTLVANEIIQAVAKRNDCITKFDKSRTKGPLLISWPRAWNLGLWKAQLSHVNLLKSHRYGTLSALSARHTFNLSDTVAMVTKSSHLRVTKVLLLRCKQELLTTIS